MKSNHKSAFEYSATLQIRNPEFALKQYKSLPYCAIVWSQNKSPASMVNFQYAQPDISGLETLVEQELSQHLSANTHQLLEK